MATLTESSHRKVTIIAACISIALFIAVSIAVYVILRRRRKGFIAGQDTLPRAYPISSSNLSLSRISSSPAHYHSSSRVIDITLPVGDHRRQLSETTIASETTTPCSQPSFTSAGYYTRPDSPRRVHKSVSEQHVMARDTSLSRPTPSLLSEKHPRRMRSAENMHPHRADGALRTRHRRQRQPPRSNSEDMLRSRYQEQDISWGSFGMLLDPTIEPALIVQHRDGGVVHELPPPYPHFHPNLQRS